MIMNAIDHFLETAIRACLIALPHIAFVSKSRADHTTPGFLFLCVSAHSKSFEQIADMESCYILGSRLLNCLSDSDQIWKEGKLVVR